MAKDNVDLICSIAELSGLFEHTASLGDFLQRVVASVGRHMKAAVCSIYLFDEASQELVLSATYGLDARFVGKVRLEVGEGITGLALAQLRPVCEGDAPNAPSFKFIPGLDDKRYRAFLAVPILRSVKRVVEAARNAGVDVSICGDMAWDLRLVPFLLGIGIRKLSMDARQIPRVQAAIAGIDAQKAAVAAEQLLAMTTIRDVAARLGVARRKDEGAT